MDRSAFVIFASEVRAQLDRVEAVHELVEARAAISGPAGTESLGYQLHNLYCACEELFQIVATAFENQIDDTAGYHSELLKRMCIPMGGVRPRVISDESFRLLDSLRAFRHVFRHAYGSSLDERKLNIVLEDARALHAGLRADIVAFLRTIHVEDADEQ